MNELKVKLGSLEVFRQVIQAKPYV